MLLGGIPYIAASATTVYTAYAAGLAATGVVSYMDPGAALAVFDRALEFQVTYGAVMLSFLGQFYNSLVPRWNIVLTLVRGDALGNGDRSIRWSEWV